MQGFFFIVFFAVMLGVCSPVFAVMESVNRFFDWLDKRELAHWDTSYVTPYKTHWVVAAEPIAFRNVSIDGGTSEKDVVDGVLKSDLALKLALHVGYRALGLSYSFDFVDHDRSIMLTYYDNVFGAELFYNHSSSVYGAMSGDVYVEKNKLRRYNLLIDAYYVINNKKFSYPAGLSQANLQKKSAGSLLLGIAYARTEINVLDIDLSKDLLGLEWMEISEVAIGFGYAHNFAYNIGENHHFLFMFSFLPHLTLVNDYRSKGDDGEPYGGVWRSWVWNTKSFKELQIIWMFRNSFSYSFRNMFLGMNFTAFFQEMTNDDVRVENRVLILRGFAGVRF